MQVSRSTFKPNVCDVRGRLTHVAAIWGLPGYTFRGIYKEVHKHFGSSVQNYIVAARTVQGYDDWSQSTPEEREDIVKRWRVIKKEVERNQQACEVQTFVDERKEKWGLANRKTKAKDQSATASSVELDATPTSPRVAKGFDLPLSSHSGNLAHDREIEEAIRQSVAQSSHGNTEEDWLIERAIRASMKELDRMQSTDVGHEEAMDKVLEASIAEARAHHGGGLDHGQLEAALRKSIREATQQQRSEDSGIDTEEDEYVKQALEESKKTATAGPEVDDDEHIKRVIEESKHTVKPKEHRTDEEDEEMKRAIEESKKTAASLKDVPAGENDEELIRAIEESNQTNILREKEEQRERTEEEIVLEYVKKQSLKEAEHRSALQANLETETTDYDSAEELEKALKLSVSHDGTGEGSSAGPSTSK